MKFQVNNQKFFVSFPELTEQQDTKRTVACNIKFLAQDRADSKILSSATATCSDKDRFIRIVGEKISLQRALASTNFSKEERRDVWRAYLNSSTKRRKLNKNLVNNLLEQAH